MLATKPRYMLAGPGRFVRFFRFEDLEGKPDPEEWGPKYSRPPKKPPEKPFKSNSASGQPFEFSAALHKKTLAREFQAAVAADRKRRTDAEIIAAYEAARKIGDNTQAKPLDARQR